MATDQEATQNYTLRLSMKYDPVPDLLSGRSYSGKRSGANLLGSWAKSISISRVAITNAAALETVPPSCTLVKNALKHQANSVALSANVFTNEPALHLVVNIEQRCQRVIVCL